MSQPCLKRLSYGHWHFNGKFQYVFWLQRRIPFESTIKCSFRHSYLYPVLIMLDYCLLGNIPEEICDFPILNWESNKAAVGVWQLAEKQVWGPDTALRPPCLETPTLHIFYITRVIHIWLKFPLKNYHVGNDAATISSGCDDDVLCAVVFLWLHQSESGEHKGDWTDSGTLPVLTSAQSQTLGALLASVLREAIVGVCRGRKQVLFSSVVKHTVLETPSSLRHWGPFSINT